MNRIILAFLLVSFAPLSANSQQLFKYFFRASCAEKCWFICHPFSAGNAIRASRQAVVLTDSIISNKLLDSIPAGGQVDAFRHGIWMALMVQTMPEKRALKLGIAHERSNYKWFKKGMLEDGEIICEAFCRMDSLNNRTGASIGSRNKGADVSCLVQKTVAEIQRGMFVVLWMSDKKEFYDCSGKRIDLELYKGQWEIPICLVQSDHSKN